MTVKEAYEMAMIPIQCGECDPKTVEFATIAAGALWKLIPKKPIETNPYLGTPEKSDWYECPVCRATLKTSYIFCPDCGNKIGWKK